MKYARIERERRFLLDAPPDDLGARSFQRIIDRYISDTRLRLRRIEDASGAVVALKLGQKYGAPGSASYRTVITNFYLNEEEYRILALLGACTLTKRRYRYEHDGHPFGIDIFEGALSGLILAEAEAETDEHLRRLEAPPFAMTEVTDDLLFTGGVLATTPPHETLEHTRRRLRAASKTQA